MKRWRLATVPLSALLLALTTGCPPTNDGEGQGEGTGEGAGEGVGEIEGEGELLGSFTIINSSGFEIIEAYLNDGEIDARMPGILDGTTVATGSSFTLSNLPLGRYRAAVAMDVNGIRRYATEYDISIDEFGLDWEWLVVPRRAEPNRVVLHNQDLLDRAILLIKVYGTSIDPDSDFPVSFSEASNLLTNELLSGDSFEIQPVPTGDLTVNLRYRTVRDSIRTEQRSFSFTGGDSIDYFFD